MPLGPSKKLHERRDPASSVLGKGVQLCPLAQQPFGAIFWADLETGKGEKSF
jgi:hypothetical protein